MDRFAGLRSCDEVVSELCEVCARWWIALPSIRSTASLNCCPGTSPATLKIGTDSPLDQHGRVKTAETGRLRSNCCSWWITLSKRHGLESALATGSILTTVSDWRETGLSF